MKKRLLVHNKTPSGMSLIEILIVTFIMGFLATLAVPNGFNFINQQKLTKVNENVELSIREGQNKAKREKTNYTIQFQVNSQQQLEYKIYQGKYSASNTNAWLPISDQPESMTVSLSQGSSLTFAYNGTIDSSSYLTTNEKIVVSLPNFSPPSKRCFIVKTLLGSFTTGRNTECN